MALNKCMWCLKEMPEDSESKYCSKECEENSGDYGKDKKSEKKNIGSAFIDTIVSFFTNLF